jgi:uncharacterized protein YdaU (DUF1376 family)
MSQDDLPMMPFFVKDWIAATVHWSDAERGAYMSLLAHQWVNGSVPPDVSQLARIMGTPSDQFDARWGIVGRKFDGDDTGLFNNRLEEHRKDALRLRDAHSLGARKANANRRARRSAQHDAENGVERSAEHGAVDTPTSTSTSTSSEEKSKKPSLRSASAQRASRGTAWDDEKWITFKIDYPHRIGGYDWEGAKKAWRARLAEGHTWDELFDGVKRYRAYCETANKPEFVMMPKTFCGPGKRFLEEWEVPVPGDAWAPPADDATDPP